MEWSRMLQFGLVLAALYAVIALLFVVRGMFRFQHKPFYAKPVGSESDGIKYAFTHGMMPSAKESVRRHLPTFVGGILYHLGVFTATANFAFVVFKLHIPPTVVLGLRLLMLTGLAAGVALLVKRLTQPKMRIISTPDDYIANGVVDLFLGLSVAVTMSPKLEPWLFGATIMLLIYVPIGKIRHCVFFFFTRINFGRLFGRRGVLPHTTRQHASTR